MKTIRMDALKKYSDFTTYVLAMAKALEAPLFIQALNLLNTARKYYADPAGPPRRQQRRPRKTNRIIE